MMVACPAPRRRSSSGLSAFVVVLGASYAPAQEADPRSQEEAAEAAVDESAGESPGESSGQPAGAPALDLTLDAALALARSNNLDLELAAVDVDVARYLLRGSWGAFEWVFDAGFRYTESHIEPQFVFETGGASEITSTTEAWNFGLSKPTRIGGRFDFGFDGNAQETDSGVSRLGEVTASDIISFAYVQPLRRGFGSDYATSNQREAEVAYHSQLEQARQDRHGVLFTVHNAYWDMVAALELEEVARSALDLGREQLEQNQRRLEAGIGTEVEVLQAETEVATRLQTLIQRRAELQAAMDGLKRLLFPGQDERQRSMWNVDIRPVTPLPTPPFPDALPDPEGRGVDSGLPGWEEAWLTALEQRPDLAQLRLEVDRALIVHQRTLSERLAGVDLSLSASSRGLDPDFDDAAGEAATFSFPTYQAGITYNMPIGNKTADYASQRARALVRSARLRLQNQETVVLSEVRQALREVEYQIEAVRAAERSLILARRQLEAEQARYQADLSTNFQVLEFQQSLIEADASARTARVNYVKALTALEQAQGAIDPLEGEQ